jgi:hypothetical protein
MPEKREVTNEDLAFIDKAIADHETVQRHFYTLRRILSEVGKIDTAISQSRQGLQVAQQYSDQVHAELEQAKAELAATQNQNVKLKQENVVLDGQLKDKLAELQRYSEAMDRIKKNLNEAA